MKENKKTTTTMNSPEVDENEMVKAYIGQDLKSSVLIVSVVANLFVFTAWVALQVTTQFDAQFANLLFTR
jgi:hypothetical protein